MEETKLMFGKGKVFEPKWLGWSPKVIWEGSQHRLVFRRDTEDTHSRDGYLYRAGLVYLEEASTDKMGVRRWIGEQQVFELERDSNKLKTLLEPTGDTPRNRNAIFVPQFVVDLLMDALEVAGELQRVQKELADSRSVPPA